MSGVGERRGVVAFREPSQYRLSFISLKDKRIINKKGKDGRICVVILGDNWIEHDMVGDRQMYPRGT